MAIVVQLVVAGDSYGGAASAFSDTPEYDMRKKIIYSQSKNAGVVYRVMWHNRWANKLLEVTINSCPSHTQQYDPRNKSGTDSTSCTGLMYLSQRPEQFSSA